MCSIHQGIHGLANNCNNAHLWFTITINKLERVPSLGFSPPATANQKKETKLDIVSVLSARIFMFCLHGIPDLLEGTRWFCGRNGYQILASQMSELV